MIFAKILFLQFHPVYNYFPNSVSNTLRFKQKSPNASPGIWFQFIVVRFTKGIFPDICSLLPVPNFPNIIYPNQIVSHSEPVTYNFPSPFPTVRYKSAHERAIFLGWAKVSQGELIVRFVNWATFFFTWSNAFIFPSLHESQHADTYSKIWRTVMSLLE